MSKKLLQRLRNKNALSLLLASAAALFSAEQAHAGFVHTNGTKIVDGNGNPLFLTGTNLGNWLVWEGYLMMGVKDGDPDGIGFRTHSQLFSSLENKFGGGDTGRNLAMSFEREWRMNYVNEQMIRDLRDKGYNSVRVPFNYRLFWDVYNNKLTTEGFTYIDRLVAWCKTYNIYILLDMHGAPGYQNPGDHSDNEKGNWYPSDTNAYRDTVGFWDNPNNLDIAIKVWTHIASYYAREEQIWGYDLMNEPVPQEIHKKDLLPSFKKIAAAIRTVDQNHTIVAEGSWWGSDFGPLDWKNTQTQQDTGTYAQWDSNLVYQTHHYPTKEEHIPLLFPRVDITNKLGIPLIVGEIGETPYLDWQRTMANWAAINTAGYFPWTAKKVRRDVTHAGAPWNVTVPIGSTFDNIMAEIKYKIAGGNSSSAQSMIDFARYNIGNGQPGVSFDQPFYDCVRLKTNTPNLAGRYYLRNVNSKLVLDVLNWSTEDKGAIQQYAMGTNSPANQQFDLIDNGDGTYAIKNLYSGKVLDIPESSQDNNKAIQQYTYYKGAANQSFIFSQVPGTNYYEIIAKHSGKPIEVAGGSTALNALIQQRVDNNEDRARWELIRVATPFSYAQQAEDNLLSKSSNLTIQTQNGQTFLANFTPGSWAAYKPQHFKVGTYKVTIQAATAWSGMKIRFDLKGGAYASADTEVPSVANVWDSWKNVTMTINVPVEGDYNLGIQSSTGYVNVNQFSITQ